MRFSPLYVVPAAVALVPFFAAMPARAEGVSVSGSVEIGNGQPPPANPPPPVYYQPAQPPPPPPPPPPRVYDNSFLHDGLYVRVGLGPGGFTLSNKQSGVDVSVHGSGVGVDLAIGGTLAPGVVLGGEYIFQQVFKPTVSVGGYSGSSNDNANFGMLGPFIDWYPDPRQGLHLGGGVGLALLTISDQNGNELTDNSTRPTGGGVWAQIGYDFWVAPQWSLGISGKFFGATMSTTTDGVSQTYNLAGGTLLLSALFQ